MTYQVAMAMQAMQRQGALSDGLAFTWDAVPQTMRYGFIVGRVEADAPSVEEIMSGARPDFTIVGIPVRYTGAVDKVTPVGEERQYGLIAYRTDGKTAPVAGIQCYPGAMAPSDRDYYVLALPTLTRVAGAERPPQALRAEDIVVPLVMASHDAPITPEGVATRPLSLLFAEAELYLASPWLNSAAAARLLAEAAQIAPDHPRLAELRRRLTEFEESAGQRTSGALLAAAQRCMELGEYWPAVDLYEEILTREPDHAEARRGAASGRMRARWSTQMAGADGVRAREIGDRFAAVAPNLAAQSFAVSFAADPLVPTLYAWLSALIHGGNGAEVVAVARSSVQTLRTAGRIADKRDIDGVVAALDKAAEADGARLEQAVAHLNEVLSDAATAPSDGATQAPAPHMSSGHEG